jgi:hypothetical protein
VDLDDLSAKIRGALEVVLAGSVEEVMDKVLR